MSAKNEDNAINANFPSEYMELAEHKNLLIVAFECVNCKAHILLKVIGQIEP